MGNDREKALELYAWNLDIRQPCVPLQVFEVAVRNGIAEARGIHGAKIIEQRFDPQPAAPRANFATIRPMTFRSGAQASHDRQDHR
jgi:hypothetical protein